MGSKHKGARELIYKTEIVTDVENTQLPGGKAGEGLNGEIGIDVHALLYIKQMTNKDLPYSTGNSSQYSVMACMGKESKKEWIYVYV